MQFNYFSLNGKILPIARAMVSILNLEYMYGFGLYEVIRVKNGLSFFLTEHINRLLKSARMIILLHPYSKEAITRHTAKLIGALRTRSLYNLRIILIGAPLKKNALLYIIPFKPKVPSARMYRDGVALITANVERILPNVKILKRADLYLAHERAQNKNCHDALLIDRHGFITEGTKTNFFLIKGAKITTAPKERALEGVTKDIVLRLGRQNGFSVIEKNVKLPELAHYEGAFLTGTTSKVLPVRKIDKFAFPTIPRQIYSLMNLYDEYLKGYAQKAKN